MGSEMCIRDRFQSGYLVVVRKANKLSNIEKNKYGASRKYAEQAAVIINIDELPVTRAAKGARIYKILPVGHAPVYAHESDLKTCRRKRK